MVKEGNLKAAVCYEIGKQLVVEEVILDPPKQGEVKVKLAATAIRHSDIHFFSGELPGKPPFIVGHESAGYVEEVGKGVTDYLSSSALYTLHNNAVKSGEPYIGSQWLLLVRTLGLDFSSPCSGPGISG